MGQKVFSKELVPSLTAYDAASIDPREIKLRTEFNGRMNLPAIDDLLAEFQDPKIGQLFPVLITKEDGLPVLLDGHRRWRAAIELTKKKQGPFAEGVFRLKCSYFKGTPLECFVATIKANASRKEALPEDDGYNISRLMHNFGLSEEDIALRIYGRTTPDNKPDVKWVRERAALAELSPESLEAMKSGRIKPNAAISLARMTKQAQHDLLNQTEGKITTAAIRRVTAPTAAEHTNGTGPVTPSKQKLTLEGALNLVQEFVDMDISVKIAGMTCENAIRTILGEIQDELKANWK